jgi:FkbM family methyltransferase
MDVKPYFRAAQVHVPFLKNARYRFERQIRSITKSVHDPDWLAFRLLRPGPGMILDVGANHGQSIGSFRVALPGRAIFAFEPNQHLAAALAEEFEAYPDVRIHAIGLSESAGTSVLFVPNYRNWKFDGLASTSRETAMSWLNPERLKGFNDRHLTCIEMQIELKRLDDFEFANVAVLKLDTQGSEIFVLRGGMQTLKNSLPIILAEDANSEIQQILAPLGYRSYAFQDQKFFPDRLDSKNVFFLQEHHLAV